MFPLPGVYEHYKGNRYKVIGTARHSETGEFFVVYKPLYQTDWADLVVRPLEMFMEDVEIGGKTMPRFRLVEES